MKRFILILLLVVSTSCLPMPGAPDAPPALPANATQEQREAYDKQLKAYYDAMAAYQARLDAIEKSVGWFASIASLFGPQGAAAGGGALTLLALWKKYRKVATEHTEVETLSAEVVRAHDVVKARVGKSATVGEYFEALRDEMKDSAKTWVKRTREDQA